MTEFRDDESYSYKIAAEIEKEFPLRGGKKPRRKDQNPWVLARNELAAAVASLGYPEEFGNLLAKELGSPGAIERMTSWLYHEKPKDMEMIVDEMLAIREEIEAWRKKAEGREAQAAYSYWLNSETRRRNIDESQ